MMRSVFPLSFLVWFAGCCCVGAGETRLDLAGDPLPPGAVARLGSVRLRHGGFVSSLAFTPDGKGLLAGADDGSLVLWDPATGKERLRLADNGPGISAVAVSPDGKFFASWDLSVQATLWDASTGKRLDSCKAKFFRYDPLLLFLPHRHSLLIVSEQVQCRNLATGRWQRRFPDSLSPVLAVAIAPDGRTLALACEQHLQLHDLRSGEQHVIAEQASRLAFTPDGQKLLCLQAGAVQVRDPQTGKLLSVVAAGKVNPLLCGNPWGWLSLNPAWKPGTFDGLPLVLTRDQDQLFEVRSAALSPDGSTLALAQYDSRIQLWNLKTRTQRFPVAPLRGDNETDHVQLKLSHDGHFLGLLDVDGTLIVGETDTGRRLWQTPGRTLVDCFTFSADGKHLFVAEAGPEGTVQVRRRETRTGQVLSSLPGCAGPVQFLAVSPDGRQLVGGIGAPCQVYRWDIERQRPLRLPGLAERFAQATLFSPSGQVLITAGADGQLRARNAATGKLLQSWFGHGGHAIRGLSFSADGRLLASIGEDGMIHLWQTRTWKRLRRIDHQDSRSDFVALSPDGRRVASRNQEGDLTVWETETGRPAFRLVGHRGRVREAHFTPDAHHLVTGSDDGTALVWDLRTVARTAPAAPVERKDSRGQPLPDGALERIGSLTLQPSGYVQKAAFSPDGSRLALAVSDEDLRTSHVEIWDRVRARLVCRLVLSEGGRIDALAFSPDGKVLAVASGGVHCFNPDTGDCLARISTDRANVRSLAFSPDGRVLALGHACWNLRPPASIVLWDWQQEKPLACWNDHPTAVTQLAFSRDGRRLHACCQPQRLRLNAFKATEVAGSRHVWDVPGGKRLARFPVLATPYYDASLTLSAGGRFLAERTKDSRYEIRHVSNDRKRPLLVSSTCSSVAFSGDERTLVTAESPGEVQLWDLARGERRQPLCDPWAPMQRVLAVSSDSRWVLTADRDGTALTAVVRLWDAAAGKQWQPSSPDVPGAITLRGAVSDLAWLPDGGLLLLEQGGRLARLTHRSGKELLGLPEREHPFQALALSSDGRRVALLNRAGGVEVWDLVKGKQWARETLKDNPNRQGAPEFGQVRWMAEDSRVVVLTTEGRLGVWSPEGKAQPCWQPGKEEVPLALSRDGRLLAVRRQFEEAGRQVSQVRLLCPLTGKEQARFHTFRDVSRRCHAFSADGRLLAVLSSEEGSKRRILVLETAIGQEIDYLVAPGDEDILCFSPDGLSLIAGSGLVWDLARGRELGSLVGHGGKVLALSFSPDGRRLATGSSDQTVLFWDATWPTLPRPRLPEVGRPNPDALWQDLAQPEAEKAWRAVWLLALSPEQSLPLLSRQMQPARSPDPKRLAHLLRELEEDAFARRDAARKEIQSIGEGAVPALHKALEGKPSADLKRLIEGLLEEIEPRANTPQCLLASRAIAVLERIGSRESKRQLQRLGEGAAGHSRTEMAREALRRLERCTAGQTGGQSR